MQDFKILTERTQMARAINFGKYPVLSIDLANTIEMFKGEVCGFRGCPIRVPWDYQGETYYERCQLKYFKDTKKFYISNSGCCIKNSFGYSDIEEMTEYANAPILDKNQEFVLVIYNSKKRSYFNPIILKTSNYKDIHCSSVLSIDFTIELEEAKDD